MLLWLKMNIATILICVVIALIVFFIIRSMVKNKGSGCSSCGGNCSGCSMCGTHTADRTK